MLKNQKGFTVFDGILIGVALVAIGVAGYFAYYNKQDHTDYSVNIPHKTKASTPVATSPYKGWKTFTSPLSGYTLRYPADWVVQTNGEAFKNNLGGVSSTFSLMSVKRTGSYDGSDANTYMCVGFNEYSTTGWSKAAQTTDSLTSLDTFMPHSGTKVTLDSARGDHPMWGYFQLDEAGINYIEISSRYELTANAQFNCIQGDNQAIQSSSEDFMSRPEASVAKTILESVRF